MFFYWGRYREDSYTVFYGENVPFPETALGMWVKLLEVFHIKSLALVLGSVNKLECATYDRFTRPIWHGMLEIGHLVQEITQNGKGICSMTCNQRERRPNLRSALYEEW